jgi:poly(A) polymerase
MLKRIRELLTRRSRAPASEALRANAAEPALETPPRPAIHRGPRVVHQPIAPADLDHDAVKIIRRLTRFDHGAYLVGGCVRDLLLNRKPKDFDIATSATPRQIKRVFRNCRIIGRRFRLAHIYFQNGKIIEVATFRAQEDAETVAGHTRPEADLLIREDNQFGTMEEDALRRDFTINSLFYDIDKGTVLDHADGLGDLRRRTIRTIGDATIRFKQDPIRILRAIKFAARLDFDIERETQRALRATRDEIPKAAAPRILEEINRFCRGGSARRSFELLRENQVFEILVPELAASYGDDDQLWALLYRFLDRFDRRISDGKDVETGQILAALLLPAVMSDLGWKSDGGIERPESIDVREVIDGTLRPLALRLRVSKRDQEHCRQLILTLQRMVPARNLHRNTKRALLRRLVLTDAVAMLTDVAALSGGELGAGAEFWNEVIRDRQEPQPAPTRRESPAPSDTNDGVSRGRSRRQRGGRGRGRGGEKTETTQAEAEREKLPPVWDDDYFFAALPSVPETGDADDGATNRYSLARTDDDTGPPLDEGPTEAESAPPADPPARPRRRRRPRRKRKSASDSQDPASGDQD